MKQKFVDELHWLEEDEMLDLTAIAQSAPGPIAVNAAILVGHRVAGPLGSAVTILGTVLPPLLILSLVSLGYEAFRANPFVAALLRGMQAGVAAVICSVVLDMGLGVCKQRDPLSLLLLLGAFSATWFFHVNVVWVILFCAGLGVLATLLRARGKQADR